MAPGPGPPRRDHRQTASQDVPALWISGPAANALQPAGRFDAVFPLEINRFRRQSVGEAAKPCGACSPDRLDRVGCLVAKRRRTGQRGTGELCGGVGGQLRCEGDCVHVSSMVCSSRWMGWKFVGPSGTVTGREFGRQDRLRRCWADALRRRSAACSTSSRRCWATRPIIVSGCTGVVIASLSLSKLTPALCRKGRSASVLVTYLRYGDVPRRELQHRR